MNNTVRNILKKWETSLERYNKLDMWSFNDNVSQIGSYLRHNEDDKRITCTLRHLRDSIVGSSFDPEEILREIKLVFAYLEITKYDDIHMMTVSSKHRVKSEGQSVRFKGETSKIFEEKLRFKNGMLLRNFDIETESSCDSRKVRRIVEKRMCQAYHKMHKYQDYEKGTNCGRYWKRRATAFQLYNIGQIEHVRYVSRGKSTHWKKMFDPLTGEVVLKKKMAYSTLEEALQAIEKWKIDHPYDKKEMHAYECRVCHKWHIGHDSEAEDLGNSVGSNLEENNLMVC